MKNINTPKSEIETWVPSVTKIDDTYFIFQAIQEQISKFLAMVHTVWIGLPVPPDTKGLLT